MSYISIIFQISPENREIDSEMIEKEIYGSNLVTNCLKIKFPVCLPPC